MKKISWEYRVLILIVPLFSILILFNLFKTKNRITKGRPEENLKPVSLNISPSQSTEGSVTVSADITENSGGWNVNLAFDTHNINLDDYNYPQGIYLEKESLRYNPLEINVSGQLHHKKAEIVFEKISPPFSLSIDDLSGISKRVFQIK